ncbi:MAG: cytochrome c biogenesis protein ResB [Planctomycetes bacterium]|nr:cytochrome c biogenesis protein ResB [Planctomycetota bacterium]
MIWKILTSVRLAVILGFLILLGSVAGTLLDQEKARITVYGSWWFLTLLGMFSVNLIACSIKRVRYLKALTLGSLISHIGVLTILAGAGISSILSIEGYIVLQKGRLYDSMEDRKGIVNKLPFSVELDEFKLDLYPPQLWVYNLVTNKVEKHVVSNNSTIKVNNDKYTVETIKTFSNYKKDSYINENLSGTKTKTAAIRINAQSNSHKVVNPSWLFGHDTPTNTMIIQDNTRIKYLGCFSKKPSFIGSDNKFLLVIAKDEQNVDVGTINAVVGTNYTTPFSHMLKVEEVTQNFAMRGEKRDDISPDNPAAKVIISGPVGNESRWVFSRYPDFESMHDITYKNISLRYISREDFLSTTAVVYSLSYKDSSTKHYVYFPSTGNHNEINIGDEIKIPNLECSLIFEKFVKDAVVEEKETDLGGSFDNPAAKILVKWNSGEELAHVGSGGWTTPVNNEIALMYGYSEGYEGDIKSFNSTVSIYDNVRKTVTHTVALNNPLVYNGYRIYQNAFRPEDSYEWIPSVRIVKDPGIPIVYSGFIIAIVGLMYAAYIRPFIRRQT